MSRESLLAAVLATTTCLPNLTFADQPQPSLFRNSVAAQATPIREATAPTDAQWAEVRKRRIGTSSTTLRWQPPNIATQVQPVSHVEAEPALAKPVQPKQVTHKVLSWGQDVERPKGSHVRLVTQLGEIDPFDDPFGDRSPELDERRGRTFISQPEVTPLPLPAVDPEPTAPQRDPEFSPFREEAPEPAPLNELEPQAEPFREDARCCTRDK
ncbi:MAG: hypothetical protein H6822_21820 [Planctomycetaceae bacterium]|nr:hypothetical protein [Planctomycetaceae bacterium]